MGVGRSMDYLEEALRMARLYRERSELKQGYVHINIMGSGKAGEELWGDVTYRNSCSGAAEGETPFRNRKELVAIVAALIIHQPKEHGGRDD